MYGVDLTESFHMSIYLQKLASIQPRTSLLKFEGGGFSAPVIAALGKGRDIPLIKEAALIPRGRGKRLTLFFFFFFFFSRASDEAI
jgi:hypothetical protein